MKALIACAALACLSANLPHGNPAATQAGIDPSAKPEVVQVECLTSRGSAFYVGPRTLISVAHVTSNSGCFINGKPFTVIQPDPEEDFTILRVTEATDKWLKVDCSGFHAGKVYSAWGYARGLPSLTSVDVVSTGQKLWGFSRLWGVFNVIPGQSGGPVVDPSSGEAVGTVNVYDAANGNSGSIALKETPLCRS